MKCPYCGADIFATDQKCQHCGSAVTRSGQSKASPGAADVFQRLKQSREYAERQSPARLARVPKVGPAQLIFPVVFLLVFIGVAAFIAVMALAMSGLIGFAGGGARGLGIVPALMALVPIGFIVVGAVLLKGQIKKYRRISQAPVNARPAIVAGKRTAVSGGGQNSSASTSYYATFEFEDGTRTEFDLLPNMYSQLAERDAGILFNRAEYVADFDRVKV